MARSLFTCQIFSFLYREYFQGLRSIPDWLRIALFDKCGNAEVASKALTVTLNLIPEKEHELREVEWNIIKNT